LSALAGQLFAVTPPALRDVPSFPPVAANLMRLVSENEDSFSYKDVADLIRTDAGFSVEVLRLANSPVFGFRYEIRDIPHAIAVLGINRLRAIVTTLAMKEILMSGRQHEAVQRSWRHNLATALACEVLAAAFWVEGGLAYTAGLLHDVGLLAMAATHADLYADLINSTVPDVEEFLEREQSMMGLNHCEAGHWLLTEWDLPDEFREVAAKHHQTTREGTSEIVNLVALGCITATMAGFPVTAHEPIWEPDLIIQSLPERVQDRYESKLEDFPMEVATKINSFDCDFLT
jgi:putative nucleotidyltransferase with HDIG domain